MMFGRYKAQVQTFGMQMINFTMCGKRWQGILSRQAVGLNDSVITPVYLKIVSAGNALCAYSSLDGAKWTLIDGSTVPIDPLTDAPGVKLTMDTNTAIAGMAIVSHDTNAS